MIPITLPLISKASASRATSGKPTFPFKKLNFPAERRIIKAMRPKIGNKLFFRLFVGLPVVLAGGFVFFYFDLQKYADWEEFHRHREFLKELCARRPILTKGIYFLIYCVTAGFSLPTTAFFTLVGGALFGLIWGSLLVSLASTVGAVLAFGVARFFLQDMFQAKFNRKRKGILDSFNREGGWYLLSLRLAPFMPYFLTNILMSFTNIRLRTFALVSWVGMLPATVVYVNAGDQLFHIESFSDILSVPVLVSLSLLSLVPLFAKKFVKYIGHSAKVKKTPVEA